MNRTQLVIGAICLVLAAVIFVFAEGARRIYAGSFFALVGVVTLVRAKRSDSGGNKV
jgi:hypothetical protein